MINLLVSPAWLAEHLNDPDIRIADLRWYLLEPGRGRTEYLEAHIPRAVYLDIDTDLAAPPFQGPGRHPIPSPEAFAAVASRAGDWSCNPRLSPTTALEARMRRVSGGCCATSGMSAYRSSTAAGPHGLLPVCRLKQAKCRRRQPYSSRAQIRRWWRMLMRLIRCAAIRTH